MGTTCVYLHVLCIAWIICTLNTSAYASVPDQLRFDKKAKDHRTVHVVFNNHLDIGFDGIWPELGFDNNVINTYFNVYFPRAISLAKEYKKAFGGHHSFIFTTHAYLISLYLDCPLGIGLDCPADEERKKFVKAIEKGHITWHAFPFNGQLEFADPSLLEFAIDMVHELDYRFGQILKTTLSQRDVPGLTRAALPILVKKGIKAINVGVNKGSAPPDVPHNTPFIWRDPISGAQVFAAWHPGGYGGINASDCLSAPGFDHVLCAAWRGDNAGPPTNLTSINDTLNYVRDQFPGYKVRASTFEDYLFYLQNEAHKLNLTVVTGEIGDTWIQGIQSDPLKVSHYKRALRLRTHCLEQGLCDVKDPALRNFSRLLLKVNEHTWGVDIKQTLHDTYNWSNVALHSALQNEEDNYINCVKSWIRQAQYVEWAWEALPPDHPLSKLDKADMELSQHSTPSGLDRLLLNAKHHSLNQRLLLFQTDSWAIEVDTEKGSLSRVQRLWPDGSLGTNWAGGNDSAFGRILYNTFDESSFDVIWDSYMYMPSPPPWWFYQDFGKVNCSLAGPRRESIHPNLTQALSTTGRNGALVVLLQYTFPDWAVQEAGAPAAIWTVIHMHSSREHHHHGQHSNSHQLPYTHPQPGELHVDVMWVNKTATRLPEALWLQFQPGSGAVDPDSWTMNKLGQHIKPHEVINNGSRSLHAVQDQGLMVSSADKSEFLWISSLDAGLVSPGKPAIFPNLNEPPTLTEGMHFNLVNNIWGTNYVMWVPYSRQDVNMTFRFVLKSKKAQPVARPA